MRVAAAALRTKREPVGDVDATDPAALLAWYDRHHRRLPWRAPPGERMDPYRVWLSEIMLQQTTVKAVGPYYAKFLARWAIHGNPGASVLDPTCGEGVFQLAAARELRALGTAEARLDDQVHGVDLHEGSLTETSKFLEAEGLGANFFVGDFFELAPPGELFSSIGPFDAVIGNPPFVRYQQHIGEARRLSGS